VRKGQGSTWGKSRGSSSFGERATESLSVPDRATIANMAPEVRGADMVFFPWTRQTVDYYRKTPAGQSADAVATLEGLLERPPGNMFGRFLERRARSIHRGSSSLDLGNRAHLGFLGAREAPA